MIHKSAIPKKVAEELSKILTQEAEPDARVEAKATIRFYKKNYPRVQIVRCNECKKDLCLEILEPQGYEKYILSHHEGMRRIELAGSPLLSSRKRLDGVMGYRCRCGNNTINSPIELGIIPHVKNPTGPAMIPSIEPHHVAAVQDAMRNQNYKPDIEETGNIKRIETFTVERLK